MTKPQKIEGGKEDHWRVCSACGKELYPNAKIEGAITVSLGTCPRCKNKNQTLTPIRDYQTNNKGYGWD